MITSWLTSRLPDRHGADAARTAPLLGLIALACAGPAPAQERPTLTEGPQVFAEIGVARHGTRSATLGLSGPWSLDRPLWGGRLTGHWDAYVSQWRSDSATQAGAHDTLTQLALVPVLRLRLDEGRSPWFVEGGIGLSVMDRRYLTPAKEFSTRFNFADHLGVGLNFGAQRQHALALRLQHVSNGGIKKPNPGENFLQLRYSLAF